VGLAGAGITEQHNGFAGVDVGAGGQCGQLGRGDGGHRVEVELGEAFEAGEFGVGDAAGAAALAAFVDLGGQHFGEVGQVGLPLPDGDLGQSGGFGADGGQVQFAGGGADRRGRGGIGVGVHVPLPVVSSWS